MALRLLWQLSELKKNLFLDSPQLMELQWKKLKALLKHSYDNVPFYHRKFDQGKIKPEDITSFKDLSKIPLTTREELQKLPVEFTTARNVDLGKCEKTTTSGTTGMPLTLLLDKEAVEYGKGLWIRAFERNGLRNSDSMAIIRHPNYFPKKYWFQKLGIRPRMYISALDHTERQIGILEKYRPQAIKGYSSALAEIAHALEHRSHNIRPRLTFSGGELLNPRNRSLIRASLDTEVLDTYGTSEFSLVAWECREHSGYHINADSVLMEFLDGEEEIAAGERGAVVCTGLNNYAMPLIRYKDEDIAVPLHENCSCGVKLPMLKSIEGRESDMLMALDGRLISPWQFFPFPFDNYDGITQFRIIQDRKNRILFQMIIEEGVFAISRLDNARLRIKKLFGEEMQADFEITDQLKKDQTGKMRAISRLF